MNKPTPEQVNALRTLYGAEAVRIKRGIHERHWQIVFKHDLRIPIIYLPNSENWPDTIDLSEQEPERIPIRFDEEDWMGSIDGLTFGKIYYAEYFENEYFFKDDDEVLRQCVSIAGFSEKIIPEKYIVMENVCESNKYKGEG